MVSSVPFFPRLQWREGWSALCSGVPAPVSKNKERRYNFLHIEWEKRRKNFTSSDLQTPKKVIDLWALKSLSAPCPLGGGAVM